MSPDEAARGTGQDTGGGEALPVPAPAGKLASDTVLNLFGQILPLCAAILLVPGLVRALGLPRFGILSLGWMLIGYFGLLDLGLGRALTQAVSARLGRGETSRIPEVIGTSMAMMLVLGGGGAALLSALSPWIAGRWMDNVMIERLWRSLKYECVYLHAFETGSEARAGIGKWIRFYNQKRPHASLDDKTPHEAYWRTGGVGSPVPVGPQAVA